MIHLFLWEFLSEKNVVPFGNLFFNGVLAEQIFFENLCNESSDGNKLFN